MSPETFVQLFWFILFVVLFCGFLVVGALIFQRLERAEYLHLMRLERARKAWEKMLTGSK